MTRATFAALLFLISTSAFAETADLRVRIDVPSAVARTQPFVWTATVTNRGPEFARNVVLRTFAGQFEPRPCEEVTRATLAPGASLSVECRVEEVAGYYLNLRADTASVSDDPNLDDNVADVVVDLLTPPDLVVQPVVFGPADPFLPFDVMVTYYNAARTTATGVTITIDAPEGGSIGTVPDFCRVEGKRAICSIGTLAPSPVPGGLDAHHLRLQLIPPDRSDVPVVAQVTIAGNEEDAAPESNRTELRARTFRTFFTTNTNDAGEGSLRAAIEAANASCQDATADCKVAFRIPWLPGQKVQTIALESPLPRSIAARTSIDGTTQTRYMGDFNPLGPEVELRGEKLGDPANGLEFETTCLGTVSGLTINGFGGDAIHVAGGGGSCVYSFSFTIADNYLGTDPTGTRAIPNGRGVYVERPFQRIEGNLISGNRRSGIWIAIGNQRITGNRIGVNATVTGALPNGASGIYLGTRAHGTDVHDNYIGFNREFGLAAERGLQWIALRGNSFQANGQLAIDFGLDGVSREVGEGDRYIVAPEITSARYDAAHNHTLIQGRVTKLSGLMFINLYANDEPDPSGFGEGQYTIGVASVESDGTFSFFHAGRLPGPWVTATATHSQILGLGSRPLVRPSPHAFEAGRTTTTSEFSRAVRAE